MFSMQRKALTAAALLSALLGVTLLAGCEGETSRPLRRAERSPNTMSNPSNEFTDAPAASPLIVADNPTGQKLRVRTAIDPLFKAREAETRPAAPSEVHLPTQVTYPDGTTESIHK